MSAPPYILRMARRDDRQRMRDRCRITRPGDGAGEWNEDTGTFDDDAEITVAEGKCRATVTGTEDRIIEVAGAPLTLRTMTVELHYVVVGDIDVGQKLVILSSTNRHLLGREWRLLDVADGSDSVARVLTVQEVLGDEGADGG